jgi:HEAT repeat protein
VPPQIPVIKRYMEKLVERETAIRAPLVAAPALAVQFFLIPLAVVGITVLGYLGFRSLLTDDRHAEDYLTQIRTGGTDRRWPAAYELSRMMADPAVRANHELAPILVEAFERAKSDDPRVRRYLALAIGRLDPLPKEAIAALSQSLDEPDEGYKTDWFSHLTGGADSEAGEARISTIWALGSSGDESVVPKLQPLYESPDAGIRKMVVYALGALPGSTQLSTLRTALADAEPDVRWNAAVALARHDSRDGVAVLQQMLDRAYVERTVKREVRQDDDSDPVAEVIVSGLRAAAALKDPSFKPTIDDLSRGDRSMKVRQAALEALKTMG